MNRAIQDNTVEIKATRTLALEHEAQLLNCLKATNIEVGLLPNFGPKPQIKRKVFDNFRKQISACPVGSVNRTGVFICVNLLAL